VDDAATVWRSARIRVPDAATTEAKRRISSFIEVMSERRFSKVDRVQLGKVADWLVVAVAVSLPWSTSATSILIVLFLIAVLPTLDRASLCREAMTAAGGLPLLLWALAAIGTLWADVSWNESLHALRGFNKLLLVPLLLVHFRRSERAKWVIIGFCVSASALLVLSWSVRSSTGGLWGREKADFGVPVKDYIAQSTIFVLCALGLLGFAFKLWWAQRVRLALFIVLLAAVFVGNLVYVATARTALIVIVVLLLLFAFRQAGWRGMLIGSLLGALTAGILLVSSPYLRERLTRSIAEIEEYRAGNLITSGVGLRLEYWKKSVDAIAAAPVIGHGTGTIEALFRRDARTSTNSSLVTNNPHNQVLGVAIQLGLIGTIALIGMWIAHLALFREYTLISWLGLVVVVQNIVSSFFNSHLFDFVQGWIYVFGVGMLGGVVGCRTRGQPDMERRNLKD
jgi:O-antigen ligase